MLLCPFAAREIGDVKTMRNIMVVGQRLVDQGKFHPDGYHGAWYCAQHMVGFLFSSLFVSYASSSHASFFSILGLES